MPAAVDEAGGSANLREHGVELRLGLVDEDDAATAVAAASELEFDDEDPDDEDPRAK